jgi:hypothetical protein
MMSLVNKPATPEEILEQIRAMPLADREYVEAELMREAYESGRRQEPDALRDEILRRAKRALAHPEEGFTLAETRERARAVVAAARERKSKG